MNVNVTLGGVTIELQSRTNQWIPRIHNEILAAFISNEDGTDQQILEWNVMKVSFPRHLACKNFTAGIVGRIGGDSVNITEQITVDPRQIGNIQYFEDNNLGMLSWQSRPHFGSGTLKFVINYQDDSKYSFNVATEQEIFLIENPKSVKIVNIQLGCSCHGREHVDIVINSTVSKDQKFMITGQPTENGMGVQVEAKPNSTISLQPNQLLRLSVWKDGHLDYNTTFLSQESSIDLHGIYMCTDMVLTVTGVLDGEFSMIGNKFTAQVKQLPAQSLQKTDYEKYSVLEWVNPASPRGYETSIHYIDSRGFDQYISPSSNDRRVAIFPGAANVTIHIYGMCRDWKGAAFPTGGLNTISNETLE